MGSDASCLRGEAVCVRQRTNGHCLQAGIEGSQTCVHGGAVFTVKGHINTGSRTPHLSLHMFHYCRRAKLVFDQRIPEGRRARP